MGVTRGLVLGEGDVEEEGRGDVRRSRGADGWFEEAGDAASGCLGAVESFLGAWSGE